MQVAENRYWFSLWVQRNHLRKMVIIMMMMMMIIIMKFFMTDSGGCGTEAEIKYLEQLSNLLLCHRLHSNHHCHGYHHHYKCHIVNISSSWYGIWPNTTAETLANIETRGRGGGGGATVHYAHYQIHQMANIGFNIDNTHTAVLILKSLACHL